MAELSASAINNLPDADFAYIEPGGSKDSEGKTVPRSLRHFPIHDAAHVRNALARAPQSPFGEKAMAKIRAAAKKFNIELSEQQQSAELPLTGLCVRAQALAPIVEQRDSKPILTGHLAVFDQWAEVNSRLEGRFMERMARGAFAKTLREHRGSMRVLFNHGEDPQIGFKPLGTIEKLEEDQRGVAYEVALFETDYVRSLIPALEAGQFGSSFTFRPVRDKRAVNQRPQRSEYNPDGIPEVTVHELNMREFGPCMFPVYAGTSAGLRSMTDEYIFAHLAADPLRLQELLGTIGGNRIVPALSTEGAEITHSQREEPQPVSVVAPVRKRFETREGYLEWLSSKT